MDFFELKNISEQTMRLVNPSSAEKLLRAGQLAGMEPGSRVIDFGSGFAEPLALWASELGIGGVGIDIRPHACERARLRLAELAVGDRVEIVCDDAANYVSVQLGKPLYVWSMLLRNRHMWWRLDFVEAKIRLFLPHDRHI
jgi:predicted RNA methylase